MNGMQMMFAQFAKMLPPEIAQTIDNMGKTILAFKQQLDRVERNQLRIMTAMNIPLESDVEILSPEGTENAQRQGG